MEVKGQGLLLLERSNGSHLVCPEHMMAYVNIVIALRAEKMAENGKTMKDGGLLEMDANDGMQLMRKTGFVKAMQFVYEHMIEAYLGLEDRHNVARKLLEWETGRCISWAFVTKGTKRATPSTAMALLIADMARNTWLDAAHTLFPLQFPQTGGCARLRRTQKRLKFELDTEGTKHVVSPKRPTKQRKRACAQNGAGKFTAQQQVIVKGITTGVIRPGNHAYLGTVRPLYEGISHQLQYSGYSKAAQAEQKQHRKESKAGKKGNSHPIDWGLACQKLRQAVFAVEERHTFRSR